MRSQRGVTLIELAIVLGVAGLLIGGIWVAASAANETHHVNQTVDQVRQIVENIRTRYATANRVEMEDYQTFTQRMAAADVFPAETRLNPGGDPAGCAVATPCYFVHPFSSDGAGSICGGGTLCVGGSLDGVQAALTGTVSQRGRFALLLRALPQPACVKIATRYIDIWDDVGIVGMGFLNGDAAAPGTAFFPGPPTVANIVANCAAGNGNALYLAFRLGT